MAEARSRAGPAGASVYVGSAGGSRPAAAQQSEAMRAACSPAATSADVAASQSWAYVRW